jgi:hypothetical protein
MAPRWTEEEKEILKQYYGRMTAEELSKSVLPERKISAILSQAYECGLSGRGKDWMIPDHDHDYFSIPNQQSCYWAGFIAADGNVHKNNLLIALNRKDRSHLERFKADIKFTGNIYDRDFKNTYHKKGYSEMSRLSITSARQIIDDLERHYNITPKKSLTLQPPNLTDDILIKCFLVGLIDGDGSIFLSRDYLHLTLLGTETMMAFMKSKIDLWYPERSREFKVGKDKKNLYYTNGGQAGRSYSY